MNDEPSPYIGKQFRDRHSGKIITIVDEYVGETKAEGVGFIYTVDGVMGRKWKRSPYCWTQWENLT